MSVLVLTNKSRLEYITDLNLLTVVILLVDRTETHPALLIMGFILPLQNGKCL